MKQKKELEKRSKKVRYNHKTLILFLAIIMMILLMTLVSGVQTSHYNLIETVTSGWNRGTGITHAEINKTTRQPTVPSITTFVSTISNVAQTSAFRFPNITEQNIRNMTLWVYTATSPNIQYIFDLRQVGTIRCSNTVPGGVTGSWRSCTCTNPTGNFNDMRLHLRRATRISGIHNNVWVYAAYLEVNFIIPSNITIINPQNNTEEKRTNNISFTYEVRDEFTVNNCSLFINRTLNQTDTTIIQNGENSFITHLNNSNYEWEIRCINNQNVSSSSGIHNLNVNVHRPIIQEINIRNIVNLNPGTTTRVECNITVQDGNGASDINNINTTLHLARIINYDENPNIVYKNNSCTRSNGGNIAQFYCTYQVQHFAESGAWQCNVTTSDLQGLISTNKSNFTIDELYAINLSHRILEYGELPAGRTSNEIILTVYNIGNKPVKVYTRGYGGAIPALGENLAMICDNEQTIPISNQRYSTTSTSFENKNQLTSVFAEIISNLEKQTQINTMISRNTYWQIRVPPMRVTNCEGTIVFSITK